MGGALNLFPRLARELARGTWATGPLTDTRCFWSGSFVDLPANFYVVFRGGRRS
jgi:hypothetical protein